MFTFILKLYLMVIKWNKHFFNNFFDFCGVLFPVPLQQVLASWTLSDLYLIQWNRHCFMIILFTHIFIRPITTFCLCSFWSCVKHQDKFCVKLNIAVYLNLSFDFLYQFWTYFIHYDLCCYFLSFKIVEWFGDSKDITQSKWPWTSDFFLNLLSLFTLEP